MATNMALKRAAKASRRKAIVAQKRKAERLATSLTEQVRRATSLPLRHCVMSEGLFNLGLGTLVLARGASDYSLYCSFFLLDVFSLGIKEAFFRPAPLEALETIGADIPLLDVEPPYGRKLLRDLAAWSQSLGFAQAPDFPIIEALFGDVNADACDVSFRFGTDGGPLYMPGPFDSIAEIREGAAILRNRAA